MANTKVALVTGASRGAGAGIARGFGELGYTVYVTGRTVEPGDAKGWDGTVLPGTVAETAAKVTELGGKGIAVMCDHGDDDQVAALFEQIEKEQGRLDVLVNNAAYIHHQLIEKKPFWEKETAAVNILDVGLRSAYIASWHAAKMMVKQGSGVIAFGSSFGASCYMHGPAYGAQKAGLKKNDVILKLGKYKVQDSTQFRTLVGRFEGGAKTKIVLKTPKSKRFFRFSQLGLLDENLNPRNCFLLSKHLNKI